MLYIFPCIAGHVTRMEERRGEERRIHGSGRET